MPYSKDVAKCLRIAEKAMDQQYNAMLRDWLGNTHPSNLKDPEATRLFIATLDCGDSDSQTAKLKTKKATTLRR